MAGVSTETLLQGMSTSSTAGVRATPTTETSAFEKALRSQENPPTSTVQAHRTRLTSAEAQEALRQAWTAHFGRPPSDETVAVLTAQWSHETGNGQSMFNFNFGGIKGVGPSGLTVHQRTREGSGTNERVIFDNFRAYRSPTEGATDYLSLLTRKYPAAVQAADEGNPALFVRELKRGGYFTGDETAYIHSVERRTEQLLGQAPVAPGSGPAGREAPRIAAASRLPVRTVEVPSMERPAPASPAQIAFSSPVYDDLPRVFDLQHFDDALSRAALRIALDPGARAEERS